MAADAISRHFSLPGLLRQAYVDWRADHAQSMGAALAFYTIFSMAPIIVIAIAVAGLVFNEQAVRGEVFTQLRSVIGDAGATMIQQLVVSASSPRASWTTTIVGIVTMLIAATTVFAELQNDLDRIWKAPPITHSSVIAMIRTRMRSFGLVLGIGFLMLASLVLTTLFSLVGRWWAGSLGGWSHIVPLVDLVATLVLSWGLFALVYKLLPSCKVTWMDVWIGAFATSLLFTLGKVAIGIYLARSNVTAMFGAAGSIALVLLWLYYAAQVFLLGAEFTHVYAMSHGSMARDATEDAPQQPHRAAVLVPGLTE